MGKFMGEKRTFEKVLSTPKPLSLPKLFTKARNRDGRLDTVHPDPVCAVAQRIVSDEGYIDIAFKRRIRHAKKYIKPVVRVRIFIRRNA